MEQYIEALSKTPESRKRVLVKKRFMEVRKKLRMTIKKRNDELKKKAKANREKLKDAIADNKKKEIDALNKL